jgi:transcriptional regulator with XRE-family HTH domain
MRRAREEKNLSQRRLAELVGVNPETINRVENGHNTRVETMALIQKVLPNLVLHRDPVAALRSEQELAAQTAQQQRDQLADIKKRITHIVEALASIEKAQKMQTLALRVLNDDLGENNTIEAFLPKLRRRR